MAKRYYNLEKETKEYLKACDDKGVAPFRDIKGINDIVITQKIYNKDISFLKGLNLNGCVLWLDAGIASSYTGTGASFFDCSGNGNNATIVGSPVYTGNHGGYFTFNGSNNVNINKIASQLGIFDSSYTMSAYFRVPSTSGNRFIFGTQAEVTRQGLHHGIRNGNFYFGHYAADFGGSAVLANTWYFVTWMWSSTAPNARIYVNGVLTSQATTLGSFIGTTNLFLGLSHTGGLVGDIANAFIYNRALTQAEILQNFNATRSRFNL